MTKISQLTDIGAGLAAGDEFIIRDISDVSTPNKKVTASGFLALGSALGIFGSNFIGAGVTGECRVETVASGISGFVTTTISGIPSARTTISGYFENASGVASGVFYPVVTQVDIGTAPNQVPVNGFLGELAFTSYPFLRGGSDTTTTSGTIVVDVLNYERYAHIASFAADSTVQFSNLGNGRDITAYLRNTNGTARTITIQASASGTGHANVNLATGSGAASVSAVTLAATTGTSLVWVANINGSIVGGIVA
jgi:hypothetical protein